MFIVISLSNIVTRKLCDFVPQISENKQQNYRQNVGFHILKYPNLILHPPPVTTYGAQHAVGGGVGVGDAGDGAQL